MKIQQGKSTHEGEEGTETRPQKEYPRKRRRIKRPKRPGNAPEEWTKTGTRRKEKKEKTVEERRPKVRRRTRERKGAHIAI